MVSRVSALSAPVSFFSYTGELCHVLQYASSIFGLAVLAIWLSRLPTPTREVRNEGRSAGGILLLAVLLALAAAAGGVETVEHIVRHTPARYRLFYLLLTRTTAWFALLYAIAGVVIVCSRRRGRLVTEM